MTPAEQRDAAQKLREAGWVCTPPDDAVGPSSRQVWAPEARQSLWREVMSTDQDGIIFRSGALWGYASQTDWNAWVRATNARVVTDGREG